MICPDCAHDNPPGVRFCEACDAFMGLGTASPGTPTEPGVALPRVPPTAGRRDDARGATHGSAAWDSRTGLRADLEPDSLAVAPGETVAATVTIRNTGTLVEEYVLRVDGPAWMTVEPMMLRVYPGEEATAALHATPPRTSASVAGRGGFRVTVSATIHPGVATAAGGTLSVAPFHEFHAELAPQSTRGAGTGRHQVRLANRGNVPALVRLEAVDTDGLLQLTISPAVEVPPGDTAVVPLTVDAPRVWFGRSKTSPFTVTADPGARQPQVRLPGSRTVTPRFPAWVPAAAVGMVLVGALLVPRLFPGSGSPVTLRPVSTGTSNAPTVTTSAAPSPSVTSSSVGPTTSTTSGGSGTATAPARLEIPDLAGDTSEDAQAQLTALGLKPRFKKVVDNAAGAGTVLRTEPSAGKKVAAGTPVTVAVSKGPTPPVDLVAAASSARWTNGGGETLPFDGNDGDPRGFVLVRTNYPIEDGSVAKVLLETHPQWVDGGTIQGTYTLATPIIAGDHVRGRVGFIQGAGGSARFELVAGGGGVADMSLWSVDDAGPDGQVRPLDVDLSAAKGATTLTLKVTALNPGAGQNWASWLDLRLEGGPAS